MQIELSKKKFYSREKEAKSFTELTEEQLSAISQKVYAMQEAINSSTPHNKNMNLKLENYHRTLQYLTNPNIHLEFKSFDERVAFLIMMSDPNLVMFKEFLKLDLTSVNDIAKVESIKERNRLNNLRNQSLAVYQAAVREKIGFFDIKLLKYEELFFKRFFSENELITEVESNIRDNFIVKVKAVKDFNSITEQRYKELTDIAQYWLSAVNHKGNIKTAAYSVTNQRKLLGLNTLEEQLALFILISDGNLDMLRIYEEESRTKAIEEKISEQFGYYNPELLVLERKFYNRFCPDKVLSIWSEPTNAVKQYYK